MSIELTIHKMIMERSEPLANAIDAINVQLASEDFLAALTGKTKTVEIDLTGLDGIKRKLEGAHPQAVELLQCLQQDCDNRNVYLWGDAGTGKTTLAMEVAEGMGLNVLVSGSAISKYDFFGFKLPSGDVVETAFLIAWRDGGVWIGDEIDRSDPKAVAALNAALANGVADFSHLGLGLIKRHADCIIICTGNTAMNGQDARFSAASKQDAAFRDRFIFMQLILDEAFELVITPDREWTEHVQKIRKASVKLGPSVQVAIMATMRASFQGAALLKAGMKKARVEEAVIFKGCSDEIRTMVRNACKK